MLSSQRCGARTRSGKLCRSPAVADKKHCRMRGGAHWIRCSSRQQEPAQAWVLHPRGHCGTPAATRVAPAIVQAAPKDRVSENVARSSDGGHGLHREKVKGDRRAFIGSSYHRHGRPAAWSIDLSAGSGHRKRPLALGITFRKSGSRVECYTAERTRHTRSPTAARFPCLPCANVKFGDEPEHKLPAAEVGPDDVIVVSLDSRRGGRSKRRTSCKAASRRVLRFLLTPRVERITSSSAGGSLTRMGAQGRFAS
jgi:hypothetical protein